ncbi:particle associated protein [Yersinia phage fHe-Yen8-01]|nr:particle associated protein [Yersinia phage fHe-Yen8-01]
MSKSTTIKKLAESYFLQATCLATKSPPKHDHYFFPIGRIQPRGKAFQRVMMINRAQLVAGTNNAIRVFRTLKQATPKNSWADLNLEK